MSRYRIKEAFVSLGDDFNIEDEHGRPVYHVDGKILTINDYAKITDMAGREVAALHRKLIAIRHVWVIERGGRDVAKVRKDFINIIGDHFVIDREGNGEDLDVRGDILHHNYRIENKRGEVVAEASKKWIALTDTYGVEIAEGEDDVLILAAVIAIDAIYAREQGLRRAAAAAAQTQSDREGEGAETNKPD